MEPITLQISLTSNVKKQESTNSSLTLTLHNKIECVKEKNKTVVDMARCLLFEGKLPNKF